MASSGLPPRTLSQLGRSRSGTTMVYPTSLGADERPPRNLLVAVDGSDTAENAFRYALDLARPMDHIFMLYVTQGVSYDTPAFQEMKDEKEQQCRELLNHYKEIAAREEVNQPNTQALLRYGDPRSIIVEEVENNSIDYLFIGSRGMGAIKRMILGSVSDYVIHHSKVPVIVVPGHTSK